jgi:hypothetical protein
MALEMQKRREAELVAAAKRMRKERLAYVEAKGAAAARARDCPPRPVVPERCACGLRSAAAHPAHGAHGDRHRPGWDATHA